MAWTWKSAGALGGGYGGKLRNSKDGCVWGRGKGPKKSEVSGSSGWWCRSFPGIRLQKAVWRRQEVSYVGLSKVMW